MVESRTTRSATAREAALVTTGVSPSSTCRPNTTSPTGDTNLDTNALQQPNLIIPLSHTWTIQTPPLRIQYPIHMKQPEISHGFGILEENLGS